MNRSMEFVPAVGRFDVWFESDIPPFEDRVMGKIKKDHEGYYSPYQEGLRCRG